MFHQARHLWTAVATSVFLVLALGYTYLVLTASERTLPPIATQRAIKADESERWIFVGDVHGMYDEFQELMHRVDAEKPNTNVVLLGDFIAKGPQSSEMVQYLLRNQNTTQCVLGNHEINVLFAFLNQRGLKRKLSNRRTHWDPVVFSTEDYIPPHDQVNNKHKKVAHELGGANLASLASLCSAELQIHLEATNQTLLAVHAGIAPNYQDYPYPKVKDITTMKYMLPKDHTKTSKYKFKNSSRWYKLWDRESAPEGVTVLYGHDAGRGLNLRKMTKGLDSGCVGGGKLTALEYVYADGKYHEYLHHVNCREFV
ncbi:LANO_0H04720g1_1 [Lachancea nothofagi CBS 11611]|uniref:LANO_0H04720g1_1 n=1 Tax=Lachancea nothofagi CBS 11611 TaxID=1266666 RepID=A0A1G4KLF0_9SACH|nr:LANO_0H04720g1_1 [Lachancea nothofagi CBS 11611]